MSTNDLHSDHLNKIGQVLRSIEQKTKIRPSETLVLLIYPITILLGQLMSITSFEQTTNYYTNKHNFINTFFVKKGWFWTIVTLIYFKIQHGRVAKLEITAFIIRIILSTIWWVFFTQWFFGLPLMDRIFLLTGGSCEYDPLNPHHGKLMGTIGSVICRRIRGTWIGGHDPSGHVFLLVHSSLLIWFEFLEINTFQQLSRFKQRLQKVHDAKHKRLLKLQRSLAVILQTSSILILLLLSLWWWMLLITSTHFHSFFEKATGLLAAFIGIGIYLIPRFLQDRP